MLGGEDTGLGYPLVRRSARARPLQLRACRDPHLPEEREPRRDPLLPEERGPRRHGRASPELTRGLTLGIETIYVRVLDEEHKLAEAIGLGVQGSRLEDTFLRREGLAGGTEMPLGTARRARRSLGPPPYSRPWSFCDRGLGLGPNTLPRTLSRNGLLTAEQADEGVKSYRLNDRPGSRRYARGAHPTTRDMDSGWQQLRSGRGRDTGDHDVDRTRDAWDIVAGTASRRRADLRGICTPMRRRGRSNRVATRTGRWDLCC